MNGKFEILKITVFEMDEQLNLILEGWGVDFFGKIEKSEGKFLIFEIFKLTRVW